MRFADIPRMTHANYRVTVMWKYLEEQLENYTEHYNLDLDPDFQREHVWTEPQQIAFVEYGLMKGMSGKEIYLNAPNWQHGGTNLVLVDGKQRIQAVRRFLNNEIPAFGTLYNDYEDEMGMLQADFQFNINNLMTRKEVLNWYIQLNSGVAHTPEEIEKVKRLIEAE